MRINLISAISYLSPFVLINFSPNLYLTKVRSGRTRMITFATNTEINFPIHSVTIYTENTAWIICTPVAINPAAIIELPPPVDPPKKNTVIGVAVTVATKAITIPDITCFQIVFIILCLDNKPDEIPIKNEQNAYGSHVGSIIPLIKFVRTPVTAAGIGPAKVPTKITPIISRSTGIFKMEVS